MRILTRIVLIMLVCSSSMVFADSFGSPDFVLFANTKLIINDSLNATTTCAVGNVAGGTIEPLDKCRVEGNVLYGSKFVLGSSGSFTGTSTQDQAQITAIQNQLIAESAALAAMPGTGVGNITTNRTFVPGVYSVGNINFSGPNSITLDGAGKYIFNVSGSILWAASKLILENGATASNVIFNITSTNSTNVWNKDTTAWHATILAPRANVEIHNAWPFGNFTGQVFANNVNFHSGATIVQPPPPEEVPEPSISSLLLFGIGLVAGAEVLRRMAAARLGHSAGKVLGAEPMQV